MRWPFFQLSTISQRAIAAPALIAIGLGVFFTSICWPTIPVVMGMATVALGATFTTIARYRDAPGLGGIVAIHLFIYASLYLLFVGAVCDAAMHGPQRGLDLLQRLDICASAGVMLIVARISIAAIAGGGNSPAR